MKVPGFSVSRIIDVSVHEPIRMFHDTSHAGHARTKTIGLVFIFLWFFLGGIAHFAATDTEMRIVPPWLPSPRVVVLVSGFFELLGAAGLLWIRTRRAAGLGLFLLTIAVTPANVYMLQIHDQFPVPLWALWVRLPLQVALLALIAWCTFGRPRRRFT